LEFFRIGTKKKKIFGREIDKKKIQKCSQKIFKLKKISKKNSQRNFKKKFSQKTIQKFFSILLQN